VLHAPTKLHGPPVAIAENLLKNDPKLSKRKDDDGRYAIHWAASSNNYDIVLLLADQSSFDPDVQVSTKLSLGVVGTPSLIFSKQDGSGWTPLMISASVPENDRVLNLLLSKGADVNAKSK
jgi:26S proteasome non-ATPase regulatory subunit 10